MKWILFYFNEKELGGYDLKNSFSGEFENTRSLHAYNLGVNESDIKAYVVENKKRIYEIVDTIGNNLILKKC